MDSLTQIVLGAAVGEVVLGRKVGNKAILWGAIAGTIPDLDVLSRSMFDSLRANELHRGVTHSILFCLAMAPLFGQWVKRHQQSFLGVFILLLSLVFVQSTGSLIMRGSILTVALAIITLIFWKVKHVDGATAKQWSWLFWWALVTHPLLDCHTTWGTQLLWPLPIKISYNNIFVVDPVYTIPFLICVAAAMFYKRTDPKRRRVNNLGIIISSAYMMLTFLFKYVGYTHILDSVQRQGIEYSEISTRPTPFNSILWTTNVNSDKNYYLGYHSLLDKKPEVELTELPKNHELLGRWVDHSLVQRLIHLSRDNYIVRMENDTLIFCDLRFGQMGKPGADKPFVYSYKLIPDEDDLRVEQIPPPEPDGELFGQLMSELWERLKGE